MNSTPATLKRPHPAPLPLSLIHIYRSTDTRTVCGWSFFILSAKDVRTWKNPVSYTHLVPEFERVGGYYLLGEELSEQGYHAVSYTHLDVYKRQVYGAPLHALS